jgi:dGTPase
LQGKTQLFPAYENDFFRNRLTHSLEVAQIATGIALVLNAAPLQDSPIDLDLVQTAALAHDLGHPPFGHNGEKALDLRLKDNGGFEGNAQTLRILSRLEKKETLKFPLGAVSPAPISDEGIDERLGLNLTYRTLASVMKYDRKIPETDEGPKTEGFNRPIKGYYTSEEDLVRTIKEKVAPGFKGEFKTIECSIMDLADDIAYSTYDLEDAFKGQFLSPIGMVAASAEFKQEIVDEINAKMLHEYGASVHNSLLTVNEIDSIFENLFGDLFVADADFADDDYKRATSVYSQSSSLVEIGYLRTDLTSKLVHLFISGIELEPNDDYPMISRVKFDLRTFKMVEVLKKYAYKSIIMSPRLKLTEYRGKEFINKIFDTLMNKEDGRHLLPDDWRNLYFAKDGIPWRMRTVCDFIASMTDRYCVEFYSRLVGIDTPSIHKTLF